MNNMTSVLQDTCSMISSLRSTIGKKAGFKKSLLNYYLFYLGCRVWVHLLSLEMVKRISIVAIEGKISLLLCPDFRKQVTASTATATASLTYKFIPLGHPILSH